MSNIPANEVRVRAEAAYLGLAIGDALGATVEFMTPREIRAALAHKGGLHRDMTGGGWLRLKPGQVTDDTTMSLALGRAIFADGGMVQPLSCARAFDDWMRGKPIDIGNTVRRNLITFRKTGDPCAPLSEHDAGNGAAMRVLPVALTTLGQSETDVRTAIHAQAHVTHHNPVSDAVCELLVCMVQDALRGAGLRDLYRRRIRPFVLANPQCSFRPRRRENPSGWVVETIQVVLQGLLDNGSFEECLIDVVNRGGDADTTGAITGMLAGALHGLDALPKRWLRTLDPPIREACRTQARQLLPATLRQPS